jgi:chromosome segregation ATPase
MDYLLSLVGQDQDTITEAIKVLAENAEKVKVQDKEIGDLNLELEEAKEEIHHLKKKVDKKYDVIEDLEHEIYHIEGKLREKDDLLMYQKNVIKNKDRMITDLNGMRMEGEEKCSKFEQLLRQKNESQDDLEKVKELMEDIEHLKDVNDGKELEIEKISNQNENLKAQLDVLHFKKEEPICLDDELGPNFSRKFECKECDNKFASKEILRSHMRSNHGEKGENVKMSLMLHGIKIQILEQKLDITSKLSKLKEKEFLEQQACKCRGWCAITHSKHSWKIRKSEHVNKMIRSLGLKFV